MTTMQLTTKYGREERIMKMIYEEPKMTIASLMSNDSIAYEENAESVIEYKDPDQQVTKPVDIG